MQDANGAQYLLRITKRERAISRAENFAYQKKLYVLGAAMPEPVEAGKCEEGAYTLERFLPGEDARQALPLLPKEEQYALGLEAGRILRLIHSVPAPEGTPDWEERFNRKIDRKIALYRDCLSGSRAIPASFPICRKTVRCLPTARSRSSTADRKSVV